MGFFFQFYHFAWNNLPLSFVIFILFYFCYYNDGLVKLTWASSGFFLKFYLLNFVLFARCFF
jgi:hypothetical protein